MFYLYIKIHNITGLKYLGKTKQNPLKYRGSGKRWKHHLRVHGYDVTTIVLKSFSTNEQLSVFSEQLSIAWNIVESSDWANLKNETGDGGFDNRHINFEQKKRASLLAHEAKKQKRLQGHKNVAWNKGLSLPKSNVAIERQRKTRTGTRRVYREDGSWFWGRPTTT